MLNELNKEVITMFITNKQNPNSAINIDLVSDMWKSKNATDGKFTIIFNLPAASSEDGLYQLWLFDSECERDRVFNCILLEADSKEI